MAGPLRRELEPPACEPKALGCARRPGGPWKDAEVSATSRSRRGGATGGPKRQRTEMGGSRLNVALMRQIRTHGRPLPRAGSNSLAAEPGAKSEKDPPDSTGPSCLEVLGSPDFLTRTPSLDLLVGPLSGPQDFAVRDHIMRPTRLLPTTHRRAQRDTASVLLDCPFGRRDRRANLGSAAARTEVRRRSKLFRVVQHSWCKDFRHELDPSQLNPHRFPCRRS